MDYRPCIIIPIYNNHSTIRDVVTSLLTYEVPIYIIDDGSDEVTKRELFKLDSEYSLVQVLTLPRNQGKGAAVMFGFANAYQRGFTHALQLDADGQHEPKDVPAFLKAGEDHPNTLVLGDPTFDETAPKARLYGRRFNHPWVWFETGSFAIRDALCGYRLYPLKETVEVCRRYSLGTRMEFDPEIAVRLVWSGVKVENIKTRVRYYADGLSHFRTFRDNVRITWLHTRLVTLAILRHLSSPISSKATGRGWMKAPERGSLLGLQFMLWILRLLGPKICKKIVSPLSLYFLLTSKNSRTSSRSYLRRVLDREPTVSDLHSHFKAFGDALVDKVLAWSPDGYPFNFVWKGFEKFDAIASKGEGGVLLSAHVGNIEILRAASEREGVRVNAIMFTRNAKKFESLLHKVGGGAHTLRVIPTEGITPDLVLELREKIQQGEFVAMLADRVLEGSPGRYSVVPFLGGYAPFPHGPFILASLLKAPCHTIFATSQGEERYKITFAHLAGPLHLPRENRKAALAKVIEAYARQLEQVCRESPYQWFNFFDMWEETATDISERKRAV